MSNVLTIVFDKAEQKIDSVVAAAVNELHSLGHIVKEVRVTGDSGEAKVALNQVEGIVSTAVDTAEADAKTDVAALEGAAPPAPADVVENKNADGSSPVQHVGSVPDAQLPEDGAPAQSVDERRLALLDELEALDKEEEASTGAHTTTSTGAAVDPTNSGESILTNPDVPPGS